MALQWLLSHTLLVTWSFKFPVALKNMSPVYFVHWLILCSGWNLLHLCSLCWYNVCFFPWRYSAARISQTFPSKMAWNDEKKSVIQCDCSLCLFFFLPLFKHVSNLLRAKDSLTGYTDFIKGLFWFHKCLPVGILKETLNERHREHYLLDQIQRC